MLELTPMDVEQNKEDLCAGERVLKCLLYEWRNLDDRFIPVDQKKIYKETFEHYLTSQAHKEVQEIEQAASNNPNPQPKGTKKRGRRTLQESIQLVGKFLINIGKIILLTTVFQQLPKVTQ